MIGALGLGGHALVFGFPSTHGCYCCMFRHDSDLGLVNMSSFVAPGQNFRRSVAGCAGTFTPFGLVDAERAATEAVRVGLEVLAAETTSPALWSWQISRKRFELEGGLLSFRGENLAPGGTTEDRSFARADCECCRGERA